MAIPSPDSRKPEVGAPCAATRRRSPLVIRLWAWAKKRASGCATRHLISRTSRGTPAALQRPPSPLAWALKGPTEGERRQPP